LSKTPLEIVHETAQVCVSKAPVLILGSGASAAHSIPGMPGLRDRLLATHPPAESSAEELNAWQQFISRLEAVDLEFALSEVRLPESMTRHIVETTWDYIAPFDLRVFEALACDRSILPLTKLYHHIFKSTYAEINVVTPNYDRLAEYAADAGDLCHYTGFGYGHLRLRVKGCVPRIHYGKSQARTVKVWKVHGSLGLVL